LLTGTIPFTGSMHAVFEQVVNANPVSPSARNSAVPPWLDAVCARATAKRPADRFPSMGAFAAALTRRESAPPDRRRWLLTVTSGASLLTLGAVGYVIFRSRDPAREPDPEPQPAPPVAAANRTWREAAAFSVGAQVRALAPDPKAPDRVAWGTDVPRAYGYSARTGEHKFRITTPPEMKVGPVYAVAVSPRDPLVLVIYDGAASFRVAAGGAEDRQVTKPAILDPWRHLFTGLWHPGGGFVAPLYAGSREPGGEAFVATLETAPELSGAFKRVGALAANPVAAAFSPDGDKFALALSDGTVEVRDGKTLAPRDRFKLDGRPLALSVLPGGRELVVRVNYDVQVRDSSGKLLRKLSTEARGSGLAVSPDGAFAAWALQTGAAVCALGDGSVARLDGSAGAINILAFTSDNRTLYTGGADGHVRVWDLK
jgi:hypothetical protein